MAYGKLKTEAGKQNGKGRWMPRADAKRAAKKRRRQLDREATR